jgi:hypothetical protein
VGSAANRNGYTTRAESCPGVACSHVAPGETVAQCADNVVDEVVVVVRSGAVVDGPEDPGVVDVDVVVEVFAVDVVEVELDAEVVVV